MKSNFGKFIEENHLIVGKRYTAKYISKYINLENGEGGMIPDNSSCCFELQQLDENSFGLKIIPSETEEIFSEPESIFLCEKNTMIILNYNEKKSRLDIHILDEIKSKE